MHAMLFVDSCLILQDWLDTFVESHVFCYFYNWRPWHVNWNLIYVWTLGYVQKTLIRNMAKEGEISGKLVCSHTDWPSPSVPISHWPLSKAEWPRSPLSCVFLGLALCPFTLWVTVAPTPWPLSGINLISCHGKPQTLRFGGRLVNQMHLDV